MFRALPVIALRTFESSARHLSFKLAADELAVTPGAVSHQVRTLEEWLGVALFERLPRGVRLTPKGETLFHSLHSALADLAQVTNSLRAMPVAGRLTVTTASSFAALWLIPRLDRFYAAHPDVNLRLDTSTAPIDLQQDASVDVAIRYGGGPYPELYSPGGMVESFGVYGAPGRVDELMDLAAPSLISVHWAKSTLYRDSWCAWSDAADKGWLPGLALREYAEEMYALQAAIAGQGLVMASSILVADTEQRGLLKAARPDIQIAGGTYTVLCLPGRERHPPVQAFFDWLRSEWAAAAP
ncbi:LysR substrate-binding domain-containing protein [Duganella sp. S19_KUP01_CR8]|uniref:LysR substrate-binding domain-containing protein n=1 Tax=Duganella sp. S19_KUP01_CR8 TaxID=3025502 RepID=UPI002FCD830E